VCLKGGKEGSEGKEVKGDVFKRREERVEGKGEERRCVWKEGREGGRERRRNEMCVKGGKEERKGKENKGDEMCLKGGKKGREGWEGDMCEKREGRAGEKGEERKCV